ncbi:MAG TPA: hypothetical protein PLP17_10145 [Oligoflexia bacterium]|nr:hypothetical protein [Oligoflexia bacterium]
MSAKERRRAVIMAGLQAGELHLVDAAAVLGLSYRQTQRVWRRYRAAGGAGSCMGCGEGTALRMMLAATGFVYGKENIGIVNSTGCSTVYSSTYPYNPYLVPWTNSLFENAPADAMGIRARWTMN